MKKSLIVALTAVTLAASSLAPAHAQRGYYNRGYYNNNNGWNYAAAALGGALVGGLIGAAVAGPAPVQGYAPPVYGPVYAPPGSYGVPVIAPGACVAVRVPQYNQYGQIVQYVQTCAN